MVNQEKRDTSNNNSFLDPASKKSIWDHAFSIATKRRTFILVAESHMVHSLWINALYSMIHQSTHQRFFEIDMTPITNSGQSLAVNQSIEIRSLQEQEKLKSLEYQSNHATMSPSKRPHPTVGNIGGGGDTETSVMKVTFASSMPTQYKQKVAIKAYKMPAVENEEVTDSHPSPYDRLSQLSQSEKKPDSSQVYGRGMVTAKVPTSGSEVARPSSTGRSGMMAVGYQRPVSSYKNTGIIREVVIPPRETDNFRKSKIEEFKQGVEPKQFRSPSVDARTTPKGKPGPNVTSIAVNSDINSVLDDLNNLRVISKSLMCIQDKIYSRQGKERAEGVNLQGSRSCLLYTSPSPRDGLLSRMPSSA
eukprot:TRINITY_DN10344_c0_g2_i2.p1 TRINITY_DN10344_c0_g2~~TRINITY_DN10344_c0_g2_i2.p1  ORF type:complete len:361 (+),score=23.35 TRINITY_DN10344_c0_g2_i2:405-1487(+)